MAVRRFGQWAKAKQVLGTPYLPPPPSPRLRGLTPWGRTPHPGQRAAILCEKTSPDEAAELPEGRCRPRRCWRSSFARTASDRWSRRQFPSPQPVAGTSVAPRPGCALRRRPRAVRRIVDAARQREEKTSRSREPRPGNAHRTCRRRGQQVTPQNLDQARPRRGAKQGLGRGQVRGRGGPGEVPREVARPPMAEAEEKLTVLPRLRTKSRFSFRG